MLSNSYYAIEYHTCIFELESLLSEMMSLLYIMPVETDDSECSLVL